MTPERLAKIIKWKTHCGECSEDKQDLLDENERLNNIIVSILNQMTFAQKEQYLRKAKPYLQKSDLEKWYPPAETKPITLEGFIPPSQTNIDKALVEQQKNTLPCREVFIPVSRKTLEATLGTAAVLLNYEYRIHEAAEQNEID